MAEIRFRRPHLTDIARVAGAMRRADRVECEAAGHLDMQHVVEQSVATSILCHAILIDGEPVAVCGLAPVEGLIGDIGAPWLLGTDAVPRHARALMRHAPPYILQMLRAYPVLLNFVHAENTVSVAWLRHMKFEVLPAAPHGPLGKLFHRFEMRRHV